MVRDDIGKDGVGSVRAENLSEPVPPTYLYDIHFVQRSVARWREAYLKACPRQSDQAGDLCRICHLRAVVTHQQCRIFFPKNILNALP